MWTALLLSAILAPSTARAQDAASAQAIRAEIDQLRKDFDTRLAALESRLAAMGGGQVPAPTTAPAQPVAEVPPGAAGAGGPSGALPVYGNVSAASKIFNPDVAVIGNFLGATGKNGVAPAPSLQMAESEMSLQAVVDPYARADFFVSFGEEGVDLEEGYITFPALPGGLLAKVGKMKAAFGKVNTLHSHALTWADRPLVTTNLLGGEEGMADAGLSVARLIPNPWVFLEATGQVFRGDSGELFQATERDDVSVVGHLRGYHDLTESANVDLGLSYARGHNSVQRFQGAVFLPYTASLFGVDATVRWRPLQRSIYHSFIGRTEVIWNNYENLRAATAGSGFYVSGDYQLGRRWYTGLRFDRSSRAFLGDDRDSGQSLTLTYVPSEFSTVRGQYRRTKYAEGETANEFLFQFQFGIGAHGAHPF